MTAHPKIDPVTGEMLFFGYDIFGPPYLRFHVADRSGKLVLSKEIEIPRPDDDARLRDHRAPRRVPRPSCRLRPRASSGSGRFRRRGQPEYGARVGVMPRDASTPPQWLDIEPCYVFHTINAYDEGETVVLDVVRHEEMFTEDIYGVGDGTGTLDRWTIDLRAGRVREQRIDDRTQEFPRVDPRVLGRRHRYAYTARERVERLHRPVRHRAAARPEVGDEDSREARNRQEASEGVFVPASTHAGEAEGWVLTVVYNARRTGVTRDPRRHEFRREAGRDGRASPAGSLRVPRHLGTRSD